MRARRAFAEMALHALALFCWSCGLRPTARGWHSTVAHAGGALATLLVSRPAIHGDQRTAVCVLVISSNPNEEDRIRERSELLINHALNQLLG